MRVFLLRVGVLQMQSVLAGVGTVSFPSWTTLGQGWSLVKLPPEANMTANQSYFVVEWM